MPIENSPFFNVGTQTLKLDFTQFPLSQIAPPDGSNISSTDISLTEIGTQNLGALLQEDLQFKALSAEFGTDPEQMLVKIGPGEQALYLAIVATDQAFSAAPYSVRVEASTVTILTACL